MTLRHRFLANFLIGFSLFLLINLIATHLHSDCSLPAVFGLDHCADDIARAGFPLMFFEEGGFAYRNQFNTFYLFVDIFIGIGFGFIYSLLINWIKKQKEK